MVQDHSLIAWTGEEARAMALTRQNVTLTRLGDGSFNLQVGPEGYTFDAGMLHALWDGRRDLEHLLFQVLIVLRQANVNPRTATFSQVKAAVEGQQYFWGA